MPVHGGHSFCDTALKTVVRFRESNSGNLTVPFDLLSSTIHPENNSSSGKREVVKLNFLDFEIQG